MHLSPAKVLGSALTNEVGHILLRNVNHSSTGVMRERWSSVEYRSIATGALRFTPVEGERMRATLLTQTRQRETIGRTLASAGSEDKK